MGARSCSRKETSGWMGIAMGVGNGTGGRERQGQRRKRERCRWRCRAQLQQILPNLPDQRRIGILLPIHRTNCHLLPNSLTENPQGQQDCLAPLIGSLTAKPHQHRVFACSDIFSEPLARILMLTLSRRSAVCVRSLCCHCLTGCSLSPCCTADFCPDPFPRGARDEPQAPDRIPVRCRPDPYR